MTRYYRIEDSHVSGGGRAYLHSFNVVRKTARGVWLDVYGRDRFQLSDCRKRFACPTLAEALESFKARKRRQLKLLRAQIQHVEEALADLDSPSWAQHEVGGCHGLR